MSKERNARIGYRRADNGEFITQKKAESLPPSKVVREHIPLPGKGASKA